MKRPSTNMCSLAVLPHDSFALLCKAERLDILGFWHDIPEVPVGMQIGDEIEVTCTYRVRVSTVQNSPVYEGVIRLPCALMGRSDRTGEAYFRIPERVICLRFLDTDYSICWGAPDYNGTRVWFSAGDEFVPNHWTTCSDLPESEPRAVLMDFENPTTAIHPETAARRARVLP